MADELNTTPGAVSRRSLFSVAAALPVAAAAAAAAVPAPLGELAELLARYRAVGILLLAVEAEHAAALRAVPEWVPPGTGFGRKAARWAKWTRGELDALGFPAGMALRPSLKDVHIFNRECRPVDAEGLAEHQRQAQARIDAWVAKRHEQKEWLDRSGLDSIRRRRGVLLSEKHIVERGLMALMQGMPGMPGTALLPAVDQVFIDSV